MTRRAAESIATYIDNLTLNRKSFRLVGYPLAIFVILLAGLLLSIQMTLSFRTLAAVHASDVVVEFDSAIDGDGWYEPDGGLAWTRSTDATLRLPLETNWYELRLRARGVTPDVLETLTIDINGETLELTSRQDLDGWTIFSSTLRDDLIEAETDQVTFNFHTDEVVAPSSRNISRDNRELGILVDWLHLKPLNPPPSQNPLLVMLLGVVSLAGGWAGGLMREQRPALQAPTILFRLTVVALGVSLGLFFLLGLPTQQMIVFALTVLVIARIMIVWAPTPIVYGKRTTIVDHLTRLWENRILLGMWVRYNIISRYSQAALGILWIVLQPLGMAIVLAFVFSQILRNVDTGGVPFISFLLAGIIPFQFFNQGLMNGANSLIAGSGLMQKVYFPRETILLVKLGESLVDALFTFVALFIVNLIVGVTPSLTLIYLPLLLAIQFGLILGITLLLSYLSLMFRDIPQLIQIVLRFLFYLTPVLYPTSAIPDRFGGIGVVNPLAPLIDAYRDIILYERPPDFTMLYYPIVLTFVLLYIGYMFFKKYEKRLTDYL